ncbi:MAG: hypothetical protein ACMUIP_11295 [bacterium]
MNLPALCDYLKSPQNALIGYKYLPGMKSFIRLSRIARLGQLLV